MPEIIKNKCLILPILGSIQDENLLNNIFNENKVSIVFHTAAYKHVDLVEKIYLKQLKITFLALNIFVTPQLKIKLKILYSYQVIKLLSLQIIWEQQKEFPN